MTVEALQDLTLGLKEFEATLPGQDRPAAKYGQGTSLSAAKRTIERDRGTLHTPIPGQLVEMSRGRVYYVAADGSLHRSDRRITA